MKLNKVQWVEIGEYISQSDARNSKGEYTVDDVRGLSVQKKITETKANMEGVSVLSYKLLKPRQFAYVPDTSRRGDKMSLGYNETDDTFLVSSISCVFEILDPNILLPEFLYLFFCRPEFDRYARFNSWGSAREAFSFEDMKRVRIPLPSIEVQRTIVDAWKSLRNIKEQNEALAAPLMQLCQSYIQECKHKYDYTPIGQYLEESDERNTELKINLSQGVANSKIFQDPKQVAANSKADKIVRQGYFAFNRATTRNGEKISIAYREGPDCTVSSAYGVFRIKDTNVLNPYFLWMWFRRPEFDRYARYKSKGSAHEFFDFEEMCRVEIPLPPIDVQNAVVALYQCALENKDIALKADLQARSICSALMQHAINNNL